MRSTIVASVAAAIGLTLGTGAGAVVAINSAHTVPPTPVLKASSVTDGLCGMKNGDVLIHGRASWMYLPDVTVSALPKGLPTCDPSAYRDPIPSAGSSVTDGYVRPDGSKVPPDVTDDEGAAYVLAQVLPYYNKVAPKWCAEDQSCWIGSKADGRTAVEILDSLPADIISSSQAYAYGDASDTRPGA